MNESYSARKEKPGRKTEIWVNLKNNIKMASEKTRLSNTGKSILAWRRKSLEHFIGQLEDQARYKTYHIYIHIIDI